MRVHYNTDEIIDVLVSCDGKWQRCKHKSFLSAVFVIAYVKGNVLHYIVKSKHCAGCKYWENKDQISEQHQR